MERSRRQPVVNDRRVKASSALEQLKAAREGGAKRLDKFSLKEEEAVYDVVEDNEYAKIVSKRRAEAGDFIVDDNGAGYAEMGEDDYWNAR
jgi:DNA polymerase alpha subunit A